MPLFFGRMGRVPDPMHYSPRGVALQGCLATHSLLAGAGGDLDGRIDDGGAASLPTSRALDRRGQETLCGANPDYRGPHCYESDTDQPRFCMTVKQDWRNGSLVPAAGSVGWAVRTGGRGGSKRWLHAATVGARLMLVTPAPARACYAMLCYAMLCCAVLC